MSEQLEAFKIKNETKRQIINNVKKRKKTMILLSINQVQNVEDCFVLCE